MAEAINKKGIKLLNKISYVEMRDTLKSGDLFFSSGDYLISKAIQKVTNSPWSHVGIILRLDEIDRILLLESVEDVGVRFAPLSKYIDDYENNRAYKGTAVVARCKGVKENNLKRIYEFGVDELTQPYDKDEIGNILARITLGIGKKQKDREYICSELVYECFSRAGIELAYNEQGFISPEDIWINPQVALIGRIL